MKAVELGKTSGASPPISPFYRRAAQESEQIGTPCSPRETCSLQGLPVGLENRAQRGKRVPRGRDANRKGHGVTIKRILREGGR